MRAIVLAGRRYRDDGVVRAALRPTLERHRGVTLVCSAAAGADLVALDLALAAGLDIRVVLPSDLADFRKGSVADRGEQWVDLFDQIVRTAGTERLIQVDPAGNDPYSVANLAILDEGLRIARDASEVVALVVWDGRRDKPPDYTDEFRIAAAERGFQMIELRVPE